MSNCYGIYQIRLPMEIIWNKSINSIRRQFYSKIYSECLISKAIYDSYNIAYPDKFIGLNIMDKECTEENFLKSIEDISNEVKIIEYMCHPV